MNDSSPERFTLTLPVLPSDIDELGHVNNVVYLRWVQDVAVAHWNSATTEEQRAATAWVVVRHEVDYRHPARPGDKILARTWVGSASERTFERHTEILRASDQRLLAEARTLWCPIDPATGRPMRVGNDIRGRFSVPGEMGARQKE